MSATHNWSFPDGTRWRQDDSGTKFDLTELGGAAVLGHGADLPLNLIVGAKIHGSSLPEPCPAARSGGWFPSEFAYCPNCGSALNSKSPDSFAWIPPFGSRENTRISEEILERVDVQAGEAITPPFAIGSPRFFVARFGAQKRVLLALNLRDGTARVFSPLAARPWVELKSSWSPANLDSGWSVALDWKEEKLVLPDAAGLACLAIDWAGGELKVQHTVKGRCLAGPGVVSASREPSEVDTICAPMVDPSGQMTLAWGRSGAWFSVPISGDLKPDETFGQPVRPRPRLLIWPSRRGALAVELTRDGQLSASWRAWRAEDGKSVQALVDTGPVWRSKEGDALQACKEISGDRRSVEIKLFDLEHLVGSHVLHEGNFLTTGAVAFSRYHDHWERPDEHTPTEQARGEIRLPLFQFHQSRGSGVKEPGRAVVAFFSCPRDTETEVLSGELLRRPGLRARLSLGLCERDKPTQWMTGPGGASAGEESKLTWNLGEAPLAQIESFMHDGWFWVHLPQPARLLRWPLHFEGQ
jgi:hypothetical protein